MHVHHGHAFRCAEHAGSPRPRKDSRSPGKGNTSALMPTAGIARAHRAAEFARWRGGRSPTGAYVLRRRCGPRCGVSLAPADGSAAPGRPHRAGFRSALDAPTDAVWLKFHLPSHPEGSNGGVRNPNPLACGIDTPYGPVRVPRLTSRVAILSRAESVSPVAVVRTAMPASRSCLPRLGAALPIMTLLAPSSRSDVIRSREISRPSPVKADGPVR
jgi:hypothetical protein